MTTLPGSAVGAGRAVTVGVKELVGIDPFDPGLTAFSVGEGGMDSVMLDIGGLVSAGLSFVPQAASVPIPASAAAAASRAIERCVFRGAGVGLFMVFFLSFEMLTQSVSVRRVMSGVHRPVHESDDSAVPRLSSQNLLAACLDVDDLRENPTAEGFDRLDATLRETVNTLRTTVATLPPQVLEQVGLSAAVRELAVRHEQRWGTPVQTDIDEMVHPDSQALVYRAARELLSNAHRHSRSTELDVRLYNDSNRTVLRVADDGIEFDPDILAQRVSEGHIGLASLIVGVEAAGGSVDFRPRAGGGTEVTVTVPDRFDSEPD